MDGGLTKGWAMQKLLSLDPTMQIAAGATAAASTAASFATGDWSIAVFGVPLATVLAAFAGAVVSNTFMPSQGLMRMAWVLAAGTLVGAYLAPLVAKIPQVFIPSVTQLPDTLEKPIAFLLGLAVQVGVPAFLSRIKNKGGDQP